MYVYVCMYLRLLANMANMSKRIHLQKEYRKKTSTYKFKVTYTIAYKCI